MDLTNTGIVALRRRERHGRRTVVVLGAPRGGTTMVAGLLHHLGIHMGDSYSATFEDRALSRAVEAGDLEAVRSIRKERDGAYEVWGWKRPSAVNHLDVVAQWRDPYYIAVYRDVLALASRKALAVPGADVGGTMRGALRIYERVTDFVTDTPQPCLLISYEKALQRPRLVVEEVSGFVGVPPTEAAVEYVRPDPPDYLAEVAERRTASS